MSKDSIWKRRFQEAFDRAKKSPLNQEGVDTLAHALAVAQEKAQALLEENLKDVENPVIRQQRKADVGWSFSDQYEHALKKVIRGEKSADEATQVLIDKVELEDSPFAFHIIMKTLPDVCAALNVEPPERAKNYQDIEIPNEVFVSKTRHNVKWDFGFYFNPRYAELMDRKGKSGSYTAEDIPRFDEAFIAAMTVIDAEREHLIGDLDKDDRSLDHREHETYSVAITYREWVVSSLIKGQTIDEIADKYIADYAQKSPFKFSLMQKSMPAFCEVMGLPEPTQLTQRPPPKRIVVIDDSLQMDLRARQIDVDPKNLFNDSDQPVIVNYARNKRDAAALLKNIVAWDGDKIDAVICDYKLHRPGEEEVWGDAFLKEYLSEAEEAPGKVFLISKSGFKEEDIAKLETHEIEYAHANELHAIAAKQTQNPALLQFATEVSKTSNLRSWVNGFLGTSHPTGIYQSPDIAALEKGRIGVTEVIRRLDAGKISQLEAYEILDHESLEDAFQTRVDTSGVSENDTLSTPPGITGPSFHGHLALSQEGVEGLGSQTNPLLVLDRDYVANDLSFMKDISGLVLLKKGTQHVSSMAKNLNIPVGFARGTEATSFKVKDGALYIQDRALGDVLFAQEGDAITFDGNNFTIAKGHIPLIEPDNAAKAAVEKLSLLAPSHIGLNWHVHGEPDQTGVRVGINIDGPQDLKNAIASGLNFTGVGLYRSERSLREAQHIQSLQNVMLSPSGGEAYEEALGSLRAVYESEFDEIMIIAAQRAQLMKDQDNEFPLTLRLLDASYQDFIPSPDDEDKLAMAFVSNTLGIDEAKVREISAKIYEEKKRGAALAMDYPELYSLQCDGLFKAAKEHGICPKILIPNLSSIEELETIQGLIEASAEAHGMQGKYKLGVMLERLETLLTTGYISSSDKEKTQAIAERCDFVSFGFNDATEAILRIGRGDPEAIADWQMTYSNPFDPFVVLDKKVKEVIERTAKHLREYNEQLEIYGCGDQTTSAANADLFQQIGLKGISVPPRIEDITRGLIHSGGAALRSYTTERERLAQIKQELSQGDYEGDVAAIPFPKAYARSNRVFLCVEDEVKDQQRLIHDLEGYPIVIASSFTEALSHSQRIRADGKEAILVSDILIDFGDAPEDDLLEAHPWISDMPEDAKWGEVLLQAASQGRLQGVNPQHLMAMSSAGRMGGYDLPEGTAAISKIGDFEETLIPMLDRALRLQSGTTTPPQPKI